MCQCSYVRHIYTNPCVRICHCFYYACMRKCVCACACACVCEYLFVSKCVGVCVLRACVRVFKHNIPRFTNSHFLTKAIYVRIRYRHLCLIFLNSFSDHHCFYFASIIGLCVSRKFDIHELLIHFLKITVLKSEKDLAMLYFLKYLKEEETLPHSLSPNA